ncbi:MAG: fibrobacter succinogenes major paralogous domain-containing protein [Bacteroidales bacterium]
MNKLLAVFISLLFISFVFISCDKEELQDQDDTHETDDTQDDDNDDDNDDEVDPAIVFTKTVEEITINSATTGGNITEDGGALVTARGVVLSNNNTPTIEENLLITEDGEGTGEFVSELSGLEPETMYYVRAYATNEAGTAYGDALSFTTIAEEPETVVDIDGNEYSTVIIGEQVWMAENLKTTKYNDGEQIPYTEDDIEWSELREGSYGVYNHDTDLGEIYGAAYNFFAVSTRKLCPVGWRVPDDNDWDILIEFLGGSDVAADKLKETGTEHWNSPNAGATNESGFTALGAGHRYNCGGFNSLGSIAMWWSQDEVNSVSGANRTIYVDYPNVYNYGYNKNGGLSVRCIKK